MAEALIVGIDPGNTSAVAAVNLEGELELLESRRELPQEEIIRMVIDAGSPVVVACDTGEMPSTVEKVASSLGAERFEPDEDLPRERKENLGEGENSHEKDAAASAINAYRNLQREIEKIESYSERTGIEKDRVAKTYFSGDFNSLKQEAL